MKLSPARYDAYLASGWFRGSVMLYKMDLLCIERDVYSVVNIRLSLPEHVFKTRHRKLLRRNDGQFTTVFGKAHPNAEKEALYHQHKSRFKGFVHSSLRDYLTQGHPNTVFDTHELCVYDHDKLVAVSFFDLGQTALASLIGLYDPDYQSMSLGTYTMLKEITYARELGLRWYYPGYVLDRPSTFNYKLALGNFQYYNENKRWGNYANFDSSKTMAWKFNQKMARVEDFLRHHAIEYKTWLYPFFSMGYMGYWNVSFLRSPQFLEIPIGPNPRTKLAVTYDLELGQYEILWLSIAHAHDHLVNMEISHEFQQDTSYYMELMEVIAKDLETNNLEEIREFIVALASRGRISSEDSTD